MPYISLHQCGRSICSAGCLVACSTWLCRTYGGLRSRLTFSPVGRGRWSPKPSVAPWLVALGVLLSITGSLLVTYAADGPGLQARQKLATLPQAGSILCVYAAGGGTGAPCANAVAYQTIQQAIDAATSGDQIRVASWSTDVVAGYSPITVSKPLTIAGGYTGGTGGFTTPITPTHTIIDGIQPPARPALTVKGSATVRITNIIARGGVLNTAGTIVVPDDTLFLQSGGSVSGHFVLERDAFVDFISPGTAVLVPGTRFDGDGLPRVRLMSGGSVRVNGDLVVRAFQVDAGVVTLNGALTASDLTLAAGTIGGNGNLTVSHSLAWTAGGEMTGAGMTTILRGATLTLTGSDLKTMSGRTLKNVGTIKWIAGSIRTGFGTAIINDVGAIFEIATPDDSIFDYYDASGRSSVPFNNLGTIRKVSTGVTTFGFTMNNQGMLDIRRGTLNLANGGTSSGTAYAAAGAVLRFSGGQYILSPASKTNINGTLSMAGGKVLVAGDLLSPGQVDIGGGDIAVTGVYSVTGATTVRNGTIVFDGPSAATSAATYLSGGTLGGSGTFVVSSRLSWTGGAMAGTGRTVVPTVARLTLQGPDLMILDGRTIDNTGLIVWTGGPILSRDQAVFNNLAGATFIVRPPDGTAYNDGGSGSIFNNAGLVTKFTSGVTSIGMSFHNTGTISVTAGALELGGDLRNEATIALGRGSRLTAVKQFTQSAGVTTLDHATLAAGTGIDFAAGKFIGVGKLAANVRNSAEMSMGAIPGALSVSGEYVQTDRGVLTLKIGRSATGIAFDQLHVLGKVAVDGTLNLVWNDGLIPDIGASLPIITTPMSHGAFARVSGLLDLDGNNRVTMFYLGDRISVVAARLAYLPFTNVSP